MTGGEERDAASPPGIVRHMQTDALFELVYDRLKAIAGRRRASSAGETMQTTALVHELYLRLGDESLAFEHPSQFLTYAAHAMRHLVINRARDRLRQRAGGAWQRMTLTGAANDLVVDSAERAIEIDDALHRLESVDARALKVVELVYFAGLTLEDAANTLGLSRRTVDRDWRFARAFLKTEFE